MHPGQKLLNNPLYAELLALRQKVKELEAAAAKKPKAEPTRQFRSR